jgi:IS30 family transposase
MVNRLKMVQKELLYALFSDKWSIRKIHKTIGIHRATITRYKKEWIQAQKNKSSISTSTSNSNPPIITLAENSENVPLCKNQVPAEGVVHFQVPTDKLF